MTKQLRKIIYSMQNTISILGCGWLGKKLGEHLMKLRYDVKCSTASAENVQHLLTSGMKAFRVNVHTDSVETEHWDFFNTGVLVISIPPPRDENPVVALHAQITNIIGVVRKFPIGKVIFISSTSVYPNTNAIVTEEETAVPETVNGRALLKAERLLMDMPDCQTSVLRFGGLIGPGRNPARFLLHKKGIPGKTPVNLIHQTDAVEIISHIIRKGGWGEVYNACCPEHPSRGEFYTRAAQVSNLPPPEFTEDEGTFKIVKSDKLIRLLGYSFHYRSPLDYLDELERSG